MLLEDELHDDMIALFRSAGEATGYWGRRYLQAVRRQGGLARAREMLKPRTSSQRAGLDALIEAGRKDLTLEALVLQPKYAGLFSTKELREARRRVGEFEASSSARAGSRGRLYPDELEPGATYPEGARKQVRVNAVERNSGAREACLAHHGRRCAACDLSFEEQYGEIGRNFIHVHHTTPLANVTRPYRVDPVRDLVPVCPNCHAMLHTDYPPLSVEELRRCLHSLAR